MHLCVLVSNLGEYPASAAKRSQIVNLAINAATCNCELNKVKRKYEIGQFMESFQYMNMWNKTLFLYEYKYLYCDSKNPLNSMNVCVCVLEQHH